MNNEIKDKIVLVTGGTGSIGSEIVQQALSNGAKKVIAFSRDEIKHFMMLKQIKDERIESYIGDVRDKDGLERLFLYKHVDIIYHAAAMKHVVMAERHPIESVYTNIIGTQNVIDLALKHSVPRVITISTDKAAAPVNVMGACKFIAERITINANNISCNGQLFSCVRFGNVANSRGSVIPVFLDSLINKKALYFTDRAVTRFIMEIPEAVQLVIRATSYMKGGDVFILKMKAFKLGDLIDIFVDRIASRLNIDPNELQIIEQGLLPGEKLHETLVTDIESKFVTEIDDMFVYSPKYINKPYGHTLSTNIYEYSSNHADFITKNALEQIVLKYIESVRAMSV